MGVEKDLKEMRKTYRKDSLSVERIDILKSMLKNKSKDKAVLDMTVATLSTRVGERDRKLLKDVHKSLSKLSEKKDKSGLLDRISEMKMAGLPEPQVSPAAASAAGPAEAAAGAPSRVRGAGVNLDDIESDSEDDEPHLPGGRPPSMAQLAISPEDLEAERAAVEDDSDESAASESGDSDFSDSEGADDCNCPSCKK
ncbi:MAG: hypothetical protein AAB966_04525 [Patescibacteria group bacterium]